MSARLLHTVASVFARAEPQPPDPGPTAQQEAQFRLDALPSPCPRPAAHADVDADREGMSSWDACEWPGGAGPDCPMTPSVASYAATPILRHGPGPEGAPVSGMGSRVPTQELDRRRMDDTMGARGLTGISTQSYDSFFDGTPRGFRRIVTPVTPTASIPVAEAPGGPAVPPLALSPFGTDPSGVVVRSSSPGDHSDDGNDAGCPEVGRTLPLASPLASPSPSDCGDGGADLVPGASLETAAGASAAVETATEATTGDTAAANESAEQGPGPVRIPRQVERVERHYDDASSAASHDGTLGSPFSCPMTRPDLAADGPYMAEIFLMDDDAPPPPSRANTLTASDSPSLPSAVAAGEDSPQSDDQASVPEPEPAVVAPHWPYLSSAAAAEGSVSVAAAVLSRTAAMLGTLQEQRRRKVEYMLLQGW